MTGKKILTIRCSGSGVSIKTVKRTIEEKLWAVIFCCAMGNISTFITLIWVIWNIYADSLIDSIHFIHWMMDAEKKKGEVKSRNMHSTLYDLVVEACWQDSSSYTNKSCYTVIKYIIVSFTSVVKAP